MSDEPSDRRVRTLIDIIPAHWDRKPLGLAHEIRGFLMSIRDEGSSIDSGGGDGTGDLWVTVQGVEYFIAIRKSNLQLKKEGLSPP